jgi:glucose-1-phosphate adenylyltransferase
MNQGALIVGISSDVYHAPHTNHDNKRGSQGSSKTRRKANLVNIVAVVLAGGEGTRLYPLTAEHAKPALPFVNGYRIIDFVLSNLVNSRLSRIYVLAQYKPESLIRHIEKAWAPWFEGSEGFIKVLLPEGGALSGHFRGTADAVYQSLERIRAHKPASVAVFAADHVYRMDVAQMADFHVRRAAEVSVAAVAVPLERASSFGIISTEADGRVLEFREKPEHPRAIPGRPDRAFASMGNYVFEPDVLDMELKEARRLGETDFGRHMLPRLAGTRRVYAYDFAGNRVPGLEHYEEPAYWRDVGTLTALAAAQQDAMGPLPRFNLLNRRWPIRGEHDLGLLRKLRNWQEHGGGEQLAVAGIARELAARTLPEATTRG